MAEKAFQAFVDQIGEAQKQGKPIDKLVKKAIAFLEAQPEGYDGGKRNEHLKQMKVLLVQNTLLGSLITGKPAKKKGMAEMMGVLAGLEDDAAAQQRAKQEKFRTKMAELSERLAREKAQHKEQRLAKGLCEEAGSGTPEPEVLIHGTLDVKITRKDILLRSREKEQQEFWKALKQGQTRLGGLPDLPPGVKWPEHKGKKLPFLAQINLSEFPKSVHKVLPEDGHLFFFGLQSNDKQHWPPPVEVFLYRGPAEGLVRAKRPKENEVWPDWTGVGVYEVFPGTTRPKGRSATEHSNRFGETLGWLFGEVGSEPAGELADQRMADGEDWINLLALKSEGNMHWSDSGELHFLIRRSAMERLDFSGVLQVCCSG